MSFEIVTDECAVETQTSWAMRRHIEKRRLIGEALGEASMCWSETPKGVFQSERAQAILEKLIEDLK